MRSALRLIFCLAAFAVPFCAPSVVRAQPDPGPGKHVCSPYCGCNSGGGGGFDSPLRGAFWKLFDAIGSLFEGPSPEERAERARREREARLEEARRKLRESEEALQAFIRELEEENRRYEEERKADAAKAMNDLIERALKPSRVAAKSMNLQFVNKAGDQLKAAAAHGKIAKEYLPKDADAGLSDRDAQQAKDELRFVFDTPGDRAGSLTFNPPAKIPPGREAEIDRMREIGKVVEAITRRLEELRKQLESAERNAAIAKAREEEAKDKRKLELTGFQLQLSLERAEAVPELERRPK